MSRRERPLTRLQQQVLGCIVDNGVMPPPEVARHLLISEDTARGVCERLGRRGLLGPDWTSSHTYRGRSYVATRAGRELAHELFGDIPSEDEYDEALELVKSLGRPVTAEDDDRYREAVEIVDEYLRAHEGEDYDREAPR